MESFDDWRFEVFKVYLELPQPDIGGGSSDRDWNWLAWTAGPAAPTSTSIWNARHMYLSPSSFDLQREKSEKHKMDLDMR